MRTLSISSVDTLNSFLKDHVYWANGKNIRVDHLHATVAESRWEYENIHGIYLTNEKYAWMALWMAVTRRIMLRKRDIRYISPTEPEDAIGQVALFTDLSVSHALGESAYLYLFDPTEFGNREIIDIRDIPTQEKVAALLTAGFTRQEISRRGRTVIGLVDCRKEERVVLVDRWQVALTNYADIIPNIEVLLSKDLIVELSARATRSTTEIGENYIQ